MKIYPDRDAFKFRQGHVITNQPMRIVFRARETAVYNAVLTITVQVKVLQSIQYSTLAGIARTLFAKVSSVI